MTTNRTILVTGATSKQGRALIRSLLHPNQAESNRVNPEVSYTIYALTRNPSSSATKSLLKRCPSSNLHIVQGNLDDRQSIRRVFENAKNSDQDAGAGIWGVYATTPFQGVGRSASPDVAQGKLLADLALEFRVEVFLFSSVLRAGPRYDDNLQVRAPGQAHAEVENYVTELGAMGLKGVILRPALLMETFDGFTGSVAYSTLKQGLKFDTTIALTSCEDITNVAVGVFNNHERYIGKILAVSSDRLNMFYFKTTYREVTGIPIPDIPSFMALVLINMRTESKDILQVLERNHRARVSGDYPELEAELALARSAAKMKTYAEWLNGQKFPANNKP